MTASTFQSLKEKLPELSERQRVEVSALLHRLKQESPAWKREMSKRMDQMDSGKKFPLSVIVPRHG